MKRPVSETGPTPAQPPLHLILWGTYDPGKPRTRILRDGLRQAGVRLTEIHADVWRDVEDKSQVSRLGRLRVAGRLIRAYPGLILRYLRAGDHDGVLLLYMGVFDALVLWPLLRLRRRRMVLDLFLSLYDTVTRDRALLRPASVPGRLLRRIERRACRIADLVLLDTEAHARMVAGLLALPQDRFAAVPVGVEPAAFPRLPPGRPAAGERLRLLFYGQLIPLHGIETILAAALSPEGRGYHWQIIGTGQDRGKLDRLLAGGGADHVDYIERVDYGSLAERMAEADICLGIFGTSEKAAAVVPNKVYQALAAGRAVITRDSPAMREVFPDPPAGLRLVPPGDPAALLEAVAGLARIGCPPVPADQLDFMMPERIGRMVGNRIAAVLGKPPIGADADKPREAEG